MNLYAEPGELQDIRWLERPNGELVAHDIDGRILGYVRRYSPSEDCAAWVNGEMVGKYISDACAKRAVEKRVKA
jgi:hypothetical protein